MELTLKQEEAVKIVKQRFLDGEKQSVIGGYAGVGKAQPINTIIPTPQGDKRLGDLRVGDYVYDRFGKPTKILGVFPQGELPCYIVTFEDGRTTRCNDQHLWSYYTSKGNLSTKTLREMIDAGLKYSGRGTYKFKVPVSCPVEYEHKDFKIDPYVMGAFLGDGCCKERQLTISSEDEEIPQKIASLINGICHKQSELNYSWTFSPKDLSVLKKETQTKFQTKDFFEDFLKEVCVEAAEKMIPDIYKKGSIEQRFSLLQGLMDTDGTICRTDNHRFNMCFTSVSLTLIEDIQEILWSLGYQSTITQDKRVEKYNTGECYTLNINIPNEEKYKFFRLKRKRDVGLLAKDYHKRKDYYKTAIVNVEKEPGSCPMVCILVDNIEHLYLTNDFIVTHNTTVVKAVIQSLPHINPETDVVYTSFTGKAVQVLQSKGNHNVSTLHKLLYEHVMMPDGSFISTKKSHINYKVVIVDEISMVPKKLLDDLMSHNVYVIALGDPMQLLPVSKDQANGLLDRPHVFLDQIMRQAAESEIIQLTMKIRNGDPIPYTKGKEVMVLKKTDLNEGMLAWADMTLCATNKTRNLMNTTIRKMKGFEKPIEEGEKVICLQNYWRKIAEGSEAPLINGTIGYIHNIFEQEYRIPRWVGVQDNSIPVLTADFSSEDGDKFGLLDLDKTNLITGQPYLTPEQNYKMFTNKKTHGIIPHSFAYGYCITTHRAQGSSWNKVLVIEENFPFDKEEHKRWLYTSCTRPSEKLVLIR